MVAATLEDAIEIWLLMSFLKAKIVQLRAIDTRRIINYRGTLTAEQYQIIRNRLKKVFEF